MNRPTLLSISALCIFISTASADIVVRRQLASGAFSTTTFPNNVPFSINLTNELHVWITAQSPSTENIPRITITGSGSNAIPVALTPSFQSTLSTVAVPPAGVSR